MSQQHHSPPPRYNYYSPREVLINVEHNQPLITESELPLHSGLLIDLLNANMEGWLPDGVTPQSGIPALNFKRPNDVEGQYHQFTLFILRVNGIQAVHLLRRLNDMIGEYLEFDFNEQPIRLNPVVLNWNIGASTHTAIGTHGSGKHSRPLLNENRLNGLKFIFDPAFQDKVPSVQCEDVDVFVLDTLPLQDQIQKAWDNWGTGTVKPTLEPFEKILKRTNNPGDRDYETEQASYIYTDKTDFDETKEPYTDRNGNHCYNDLVIRDWRKDPPIQNMVDALEPLCGEDQANQVYKPFDVSDHGLFVAGIIHDIAPKARIYVLQTMNEYGVGTLWNVLNSFQKVSELSNPERKTIINCSLTLAFPSPDHKGYVPDASDQGVLEVIGVNTPVGIGARSVALDASLATPAQLVDYQHYLDDIVAQSSALFNEVRKCVQSDKRILSSSGNDSDRVHELPKPARSLAKTRDSTGVGALKKDNITPASYSNQADDPLCDGFMVFGGDYSEPAQKNEAGDYCDSGQGIIGIYTNDFYPPDYSVTNKAGFTTNANGYAEWAGTSFATPVLAGTVAKVCMALCMTPKNALNFIRSQCPDDGVDTPHRLAMVTQNVGN